MYVPVDGVSMHVLATWFAEGRYGDVYFSSFPVAHLMFENEEDAVAFSIKTGFKIYKDLGDKNAL